MLGRNAGTELLRLRYSRSSPSSTAENAEDILTCGVGLVVAILPLPTACQFFARSANPRKYAVWLFISREAAKWRITQAGVSDCK